MTLDLQNLLKVAQSATPGPWKISDHYEVECEAQDCDEEMDAYHVESCDEYRVLYIQFCGLHSLIKPNAEYVATFNPPTIIHLLQRLDRAEAALRYVLEHAEQTWGVHEKCRPALTNAQAEREE